MSLILGAKTGNAAQHRGGILTPSCPPMRALDVPPRLLRHLRGHEAQRPPLLGRGIPAHQLRRLLVRPAAARPPVPPHEVHEDLLPGAGRAVGPGLVAGRHARQAHVLDLLDADAAGHDGAVEGYRRRAGEEGEAAARPEAPREGRAGGVVGVGAVGEQRGRGGAGGEVHQVVAQWEPRVGVGVERRGPRLRREEVVEGAGEQVGVPGREIVPVGPGGPAEELIFDVGEGGGLGGDVSPGGELAACCTQWEDGPHVGIVGDFWCGVRIELSEAAFYILEGDDI